MQNQKLHLPKSPGHLFTEGNTLLSDWDALHGDLRSFKTYEFLGSGFLIPKDSDFN
jgi:hypothetical protein